MCRSVYRTSGEKAIEYVKEKPVDLIVLDMVMPKKINGRKIYEKIIRSVTQPHTVSIPPVRPSTLS